jgi:hypothetical protein
MCELGEAGISKQFICISSMSSDVHHLVSSNVGENSLPVYELVRRSILTEAISAVDVGIQEFYLKPIKGSTISRQSLDRVLR